jgi:Beta-propeller repeat
VTGSTLVTKINAAGSALVYSMGGGSGTAIAVDGAGNAYVTGSTGSNFPTVNPLQASFGGGNSDAFVTKINAAGSALVYSTYLGGSGSDGGLGIAVDGPGNAYVTGYTSSTNFPTANPLQASFGGGSIGGVSFYGGDAFVTLSRSLGRSVGKLTHAETACRVAPELILQEADWNEVTPL